MKDKVSTQNDSKGLRLLKQGRRGLWRALFSRAGFITLFLLLQIALLVLLFGWLRDYIPHYYSLSLLFTAFMGLFIINSAMEPNAKLTWLLAILLLPVFGGLLYLLTRSDLGHRILRDRYAAISRKTRNSLPQSVDTLVRLTDTAPEMVGLARYVNRSGCFPVYDAVRVRYFPLGDELFPVLLQELEKAEQFIYLEFFIIAEGEMWGRILEILARKAAQGVDVRLLYDGTNEFFTLPRDYSQRLGKLGIQARAFAPVMPFVSTHYNYRDHRKILVIDGKTALTGGINLADEYINRLPRFGHWKDCAVLLEGEAVRSFTLMFLQMWDLEQGSLQEPERLSAPVERFQAQPGFVMPYADCPLDRERVGEWVYLDILNRARRYVHIMTPYLILDEEMETALKFAAERGVDVRLILPGIPDKKLPWALAKTHYRSLLESGVRIYEYSPGFVHSKLFVSDDRVGTVGTINLDYRSLYHHFECGAYLQDVPCLRDMEQDFLETQAQCMPVTPATLKQEKLHIKLRGVLMKVLSPLL